MAFITQEQKTKIREELKKVIPKNWKWSLGIRDNSVLVFNIQSGDIQIFKEDWNTKKLNTIDSIQFNRYYFKQNSLNPESVELMTKIMEILNSDNYDNSQPQIDHHDVGYYVNVNFGKYDKPFVSTGETYKFK